MEVGAPNATYCARTNVQGAVRSSNGQVNGSVSLTSPFKAHARAALRPVRPARVASAAHTPLSRARARLPSVKFGSLVCALPPCGAHTPHPATLDWCWPAPRRHVRGVSHLPGSESKH